MEFQSLQKGFFETNSNQPDERNIFIRRTYSLLLLEYLIVGGISLITYSYLFWDRIWVFGLLMFVCQVCHFYFEFSQTGGYDQQKKIMNYVFSTIDLICLAFTFFFFWVVIIIILDASVWIAYLQLGVVILLLSVYTNQTETHFEYSASWIIALVTPITIEFILNFFWEINYYSLQQTYITMIITWYSCFMLQISQNFNIQRDYSFDSILIASCKLLGAQYEVIVILIKFFMNRNNNQNNLVMTDQYEKLEYFKQVTITFTSILMVILFNVMYGYSFMVEFTFSESQITQNNQEIYIYYQNVELLPFFWVSLSLCIALFYVTMVFHRKINFMIKWTLFLIQFVFDIFFIVGITNYLAYNNKEIIFDPYYYYDYDYDYYYYQNGYLLEIAYCMFVGVGIGLQSYSLIKNENIDYKNAFIFGSICPILIFISQIYYVCMIGYGGAYVGYIFAILVCFMAYLCLILYELHQQMNSDKIDFDTKEYYLGAMVIFQPIKTITIRVTSFFI